MAEARDRRHTFWPTVLVGVAGAGLAAMAGSKDWFAPTVSSAAHDAPMRGVSQAQAEESVRAIQQATSQALDAPAVTALALVALAAWGVVLVTRRWVRRGVAVLGALAGAGALASGVVALGDAPSGYHLSGAWPWLGLVGSALALLAAAAAVVLMPAWPEMGRRYDAPTSPSVAATPGPEDLEKADSIDLWKSITEGRDPTVERDE